jgi:hypothetical protein
VNVALEVLYIDDIEPDYGLHMSGFNREGKVVSTNREESHICLRYPVAVIIRTWGFGKVFFHTVKRFKQLGYSILVSLLGTAAISWRSDGRLIGTNVAKPLL